MGNFSRKHVYGEGIMDSFKNFLGKKKAKYAFPPPKPTPATSAKTTNKNAGDKIVKLLSGEKKNQHHHLKQIISK